MKESKDPKVATIEYKNYKGEISVRSIKILMIWFGTTEWHPEPQYFVKAFDLAKKEWRDFALKDIIRTSVTLI